MRLACPNTFYHVLSRENERKSIFKDHHGYEKFIDVVKKIVDKFGLEIHAFVLMANHYHLLLSNQGSKPFKIITVAGA
ncbi:MAG: transposase [Thermodesulfobacteriota bacterium]